MLQSYFKPIDIIAIITVVGGLILKFSGADGTVGTLLTMIVAFYFGKKEIYDKVITTKLPEAKTETVEEIIRKIAKQESVDPELAVRVARCESGLNPAAKNVNAPDSIDRGLFQWNNKYHPEITDVCAYDVECSTSAFCKAFKNGNLSWWEATKKCWNN